MENDVKQKNIIIFILKNTIFWLISLLFIEFTFRIIMKYEFNLESFINVLLYSSLLSSLFSMIIQSFKPKLSTLLTAITLFILAVLFSIQCVFFNVFKTYFSFSSLELGDQVGGFIDQALIKILHNIHYILIFFIPFICFCVFRKKIKLEKNIKTSYIAYSIIFLVCIGLLYTNVYFSKGKDNGSYKLYYDINNTSLNCEKFGVLNSYRIDLLRYITGFEEKTVIAANADVLEKEEEIVAYDYNITDLSFEKSTSNQKIKEINEYIKNDPGTLQNEYTGMFKGYNLIYITAESFYGAAVSEELTPTLYKMANTGFIFDNYYTPNVLSTIGGEFQSLTGLFPSKEILATWRTGKNYFPYGLGTVFGDLGYDTHAYHNHNYRFQDRNKYLKSQGFTNFLGVYNGLEKKINSKQWPESDDEMMKATISDYIDSESPFLAYYMTVSGHMEYNFTGGNAMSLKHKKEVQDLDITTEAKAYVATQIELDKALERLVNELEEAGKLDNTVFVLLADHYPYALNQKSINSLSGYERDPIVETNHNTLIIWNNKMDNITVTKTCMSSDVLPTVLNLFGVDYDSRLLTGKDILSNTEGLAIMENRSWVTDKGTYFSASTKFEPKEGVEVQEDYVESINNKVQNRINIAKWIVKYNYYNYLMK